jgi:hypothetical protein
MSDDTTWLLEHAEVTTAGHRFVWEYWTDVTHWVDPPARFELHGPFASGSRGATVVPGREPVPWLLSNVDPGRTYTIESGLEDAVLLCRWSFEPLPGQGTRLRQRIGVAGPAAARHAEPIRMAFAATLAEGMRKIAGQLAAAEAQREGPPAAGGR